MLMLNCVISSNLRKPFLQLLCTSLCSGCHGINLSWFSVINISSKNKCQYINEDFNVDYVYQKLLILDQICWSYLNMYAIVWVQFFQTYDNSNLQFGKISKIPQGATFLAHPLFHILWYFSTYNTNTNLKLVSSVPSVKTVMHSKIRPLIFSQIRIIK